MRDPRDGVMPVRQTAMIRSGAGTLIVPGDHAEVVVTRR